jgi:hypothetical protein
VSFVVNAGLFAGDDALEVAKLKRCVEIVPNALSRAKN